jgi:hypothetical protein
MASRLWKESANEQCSDREARKDQPQHGDDGDHYNDDLADAFDPSINWQQVDQIENKHQHQNYDEDSDDHLNLFPL